MIIIRYSEIGLKGKNRPFFENQLIKNIKSAFHGFKIQKLRNRILVKTNQQLDLSKIFGISSYSYADEIMLDLDKIKKKALRLLKSKTENFLQTKQKVFFRITCQRIDKSIQFNSMDIEKKVGEFVFENSDAKVKLKNPDINIQIELFNNKAYIFTKKIKGSGGLPVGVEGKAIALIENQDSIKSAIAVMKRGCEIIPVAYEQKDLSEIKQYGLKSKLKIIKDLKEIEKINAQALVVGQKLKNFKQIATSKLVLRPLIAE